MARQRRHLQSCSATVDFADDVARGFCPDERLLGLRHCLAMFDVGSVDGAFELAGTLVNTPPRIRSCGDSCRTSSSTRFSHDDDVGMKWRWKRGCLASQSLTSCFLWLVVHSCRQMQWMSRGLGVLRSMALRKPWRNSLMAMLRACQRPMTAPFSMSRARRTRSSCRGVCSHASWFRPVPSSSAGRAGAVKRLNLAVFVDAEHQRVIGWVHIEANHIVNAGEKMYQRAGVKFALSIGGMAADARHSVTPNAAAFQFDLMSLLSRPDLATSLAMTRRSSRGWEARSHAQHCASMASTGPFPAVRHRGRAERRGRVLRCDAGGWLALLEAIAVAVHFEDVDVMCQPVEQRARQPLGAEHAGPTRRTVDCW